MADIVVTWTPFALRCLDEIHYFISDESGSTSPADNFIERIFEKTNQLRTFPESGQVESLLSEREIQSRYLVEASYRVFMNFWKKRN